MLKATPESLGDTRKETPEELAERHERVVAASLLALSSLLDLLVSKEQHTSPTGERSLHLAKPAMYALPPLLRSTSQELHGPLVDIHFILQKACCLQPV